MKAREEDNEIDGVKFHTTVRSPFDNYVLSPKVIRLVAPVIAGGLANGISELGEGMMRYTDAERIALAIEILSGTTATIDGERIELTSKAAINRALPDVLTFFKLLWWVIGFNFFPGGLAKILASLPMPSKDESSSTSPT